MLSGRDALAKLDTTLRGARRYVERLDSEFQQTSSALSKNKLSEARVIDRMATLYLDAARRGEVVTHLESATHEANGILAERLAAVATVQTSLTVARDELEKLEQSRETVHEDVDQAARLLAEREAAVQRDLEEDEAFLAQLEKSRVAAAVAVSANEKAELAAEDRRRKGEPFENDDLFMYLWQRSYGTSEYSANPLARLLDGWVARLCGFREARANYWMLLEIPRRLQEHAEHADEASEAEVERLRAIEEKAAITGGVTDARTELEAAEQRQDSIDASITEAEQTLGELNDEMARYSGGADDYSLKARRVFSAALETRDTSNLLRLARATTTAKDDLLVEEIERLRSRSSALEDELRQHRAAQDERLRRIRELQDVRRDFKVNRFDDVHSRFKKGDVLNEMIGGVINGVIQGHALWQALTRNQRYRDVAGEWPDFGSGGIRRPRSRRRRNKPTRAPNSPWHWPGPSRSKKGRSGFKLPRASSKSRSRSRSRRRGGFRTGGGF